MLTEPTSIRCYLHGVGLPIEPPLLGQAIINLPELQVSLNFNGTCRYGANDRTMVCGAKGTLVSEGPSHSARNNLKSLDPCFAALASAEGTHQGGIGAEDKRLRDCVTRW